MQKNSAALLTVTSKGKFHSHTTRAKSDGVGDWEENDKLGLEVTLLTSWRLANNLPRLLINNLHTMGKFFIVIQEQTRGTIFTIIWPN